MAIATGAWSNSSESCEDKWDAYVKEMTLIWASCNISATCEQETIERIHGRGACDYSGALKSDYLYDLNRKEFIDRCTRRPDYPEFNHFYPGAPKSRAKSRQRKHHYIFDVNHKGVDFSGFVVHSANKHHHGHRLKVYLDANDNGRFDKKDELIGTSKLKNMHSHNGIGGILDSGEIGKVEVEFMRKPSMRTDDRLILIKKSSQMLTSSANHWCYL